jgi:tetrapyrrole methylase family protein/MazG family protein
MPATCRKVFVHSWNHNSLGLPRNVTANKPRRKVGSRAKARSRTKRCGAGADALSHRLPGQLPRRLPGQSPGQLFDALVKLQTRLLGPHGCPWDREQTHASLRTYLLEETYEVLEALESRDDGKFASELGDLLLQIVFHAELARKARRFDIGDVIQAIHSKMVRRHPHVFGKTKARNATEVLKNWEQIKAQERRDGGDSSQQASPSLLDGVSKGLPALLEAYQMTRRAARVGFDWNNIDGILEKLAEESRELRETLEHSGAEKIEEEAGDLLFVAVNVARYLQLDPEIALKKANRKFAARFRAMEHRAADSGHALATVPRAELEALWEAAKLEVPAEIVGKSPHPSADPAGQQPRRLHKVERKK